MFSAAFAAENIKPQFLCISVNSYFEAVFKTVLLCEFKKLAVIIKSLYSFVYLSRKLASLFETDSINFGFKGDSVYYCEIFIISVAAYALCKKNIDNCKIGSAGFYFKECIYLCGGCYDFARADNAFGIALTCASGFRNSGLSSKVSFALISVKSRFLYNYALLD